MGILYYARHFALLACLAALLAATRRWNPAIGVVAAFGIYGALHAAALAVTLRARPPAGRRLWFVVIASSLSMLSVALGLGARFIGGSMGMAQTALLLSLSSGIGAASYASLIRRFFGAHLAPSAFARIVLGCIAATLVVLVSGIYLKGAGLWVAVSWWFAVSLGLWVHDGRSSANPSLPQSANDGSIGPIDETERR